MPGPMSNGNGVIPRRNIPVLSLADLHEKAKVNPSETTTYTPKQWLNVIVKLYEEARVPTTIAILQHTNIVAIG